MKHNPLEEGNLAELGYGLCADCFVDRKRNDPYWWEHVPAYLDERGTLMRLVEHAFSP